MQIKLKVSWSLLINVFNDRQRVISWTTANCFIVVDRINHMIIIHCVVAILTIARSRNAFLHRIEHHKAAG